MQVSESRPASPVSSVRKWGLVLSLSHSWINIAFISHIGRWIDTRDSWINGIHGEGLSSMGRMRLPLEPALHGWTQLLLDFCRLDRQLKCRLSICVVIINTRSEIESAILGSRCSVTEGLILADGCFSPMEPMTMEAFAPNVDWHTLWRFRSPFCGWGRTLNLNPSDRNCSNTVFGEAQKRWVPESDCRMLAIRWNCLALRWSRH